MDILMGRLLNRYHMALKMAVKNHWQTLKEREPNEDVYGYSLYTSEDFDSVGPVCNRTSDIAHLASLESYRDFWLFPDQWNLWDDFGLFSEANDFLRRICNANLHDFDEGFLNRKRRAVRACTLASMKELVTEGVFGPPSDSRLLLIWVSDSSDKIMKSSAQELNSTVMYKHFTEYYD